MDRPVTSRVDRTFVTLRAFRDVPVAPRVGVRPRVSWTRSYKRGLLTGDVLLAGGVAGLSFLGLGAGEWAAPLGWALLALVPAWPAVLAASGAYAERDLGSGSDEYRRVLRAGLVLAAAVGFTSYTFQLELSRAIVALAVPLLVLMSLLGRRCSRLVLNRLRARGRCIKRVVVVGRGGAVQSLVERLERQRFAGLVVVGVCVTESDQRRVAAVSEVPVGGLDEVVAMTERLGADTVAVTSSSETAAEYLQALSWQLEGAPVELLVAPGLIEVAGPRLHIRPFEGLPLLSVEQPRFEGWRRVVKSVVDRSVAVLTVVALAPLLAVLAATVRLTSPGPVFFRQERVGLQGDRFTMFKFRSMVADADARLADLALDNQGAGLLFKMRADPRVTPVGRFLRRFSLDELPQLFNVIGGSMSLVGPRPPLPAEVARYDRTVSRRLLVKPGLTGLWQVSGRSDLAWEEAVRLDLRYVENWSLASDAAIIWKTVRAVLGTSGAY
nr:sugar transferase [Geodermatophilus sp. Leaf369]